MCEEMKTIVGQVGTIFMSPFFPPFFSRAHFSVYRMLAKFPRTSLLLFIEFLGKHFPLSFFRFPAGVI